MLTKRQNLLETIHGGHPDRYVNQFEFMHLVYMNPITACSPFAQNDGVPVKDYWGVTYVWPPGIPGSFPMHDDEHLVCKDIAEWQKYVKAPRTKFSAYEWEPYIEKAEQLDRNDRFVAAFVGPGIFDQFHSLLEIQRALMAFYEEPEATAELLEYITQFELEYAEEFCKYIKPDALFHHDDWGSQLSTFLSPEMFREFIKPHYVKLYSYYKEHGVELIVHHSDSYAETLVPDMIDMKIDIWQGVMDTNNIPKLIEEYGGKITFMGGINSASVDNPDWTPEMIRKEVRRACETYGTRFFIPNTTMGLGESIYPGVYEAVCEEIDRMSRELF